MRKLYLILLLSFFAVKSHAQLTEGDGHVFLKYSYGFVDTARYNCFSASGEYFLNPYIGLNYNFDFMVRNDRVFQFHTSVGTLAGPPILLIGIISAIANADNDPDDSDFNLGILGIFLGTLILVAPDGVSFHIPVNYRWDISPYANVLGIDYVKNNNLGTKKFKYAMSYGVKTTYLTYSKITLNAFLETRKVAGQGWSFGGGFGLGYAIGDVNGTELVEPEGL